MKNKINNKIFKNLIRKTKRVAKRGSIIFYGTGVLVLASSIASIGSLFTDNSEMQSVLIGIVALALSLFLFTRDLVKEESTFNSGPKPIRRKL